MRLQGDWKWLIFAGIFCSLCCANTFAQTVSITDPALESSVREALDIPTGDITQADMSRLTKLRATYESITSLRGLEHAVNLTELELNGNPLTDLAALSELINLTVLRLHRCHLAELGALSGLTHLESLSLGRNAIEDLGPLAGLTNLRFLNLGGNQISNIGPLASLTSLTNLDLDENQISDISPLASLTNLHTLNLWENQIEEITPFITPSALRNLDLQRNPLSQQALCVDIPLMHDAGMGARYDGVCQQGLSGLLNLREYWPFAVGNEWIGQAIADGGIAIRITDMFVVNGFEVWEFNTVHGSIGGNLPPVISYRVFVDDYLYETTTRGDVEQLPTISGDMHGVYPAVVEIGAEMELNLWNFSTPATVIPYRGSLVSMLGRTGNLVGDLPFGDHPDVVSFRYPNLRAQSAAILARDFGPMDDLIGGPITSATVTGGGEDVRLGFAMAIGGSGSDSAYGIALDTLGNVYTTGSFNGIVDFDPGAGTTNLTSAGSSDIFVSKFDSNGNLVWARSMGGARGDNVRDIAVDSSGNVYTTGDFRGTADFDPGAGTANLTSTGFFADVFISKLDSAGNFVWAKALGGADEDFYAWNVAVDVSGNVYTTGDFTGTVDFDPGPDSVMLTSAGKRDIFLSKLDSAGNFAWAHSMGGSRSDVGGDVVVDGSGNVYTTGTFSGTVDFDPGAGTANLTSTNAGASFVRKLDSAGHFVWVRAMRGGVAESLGFVYGGNIALDLSGNIYTTGRFSGVVDFDPGPDTANLDSGSALYNDDIYVSKLDSSGNFVWAKALGGTVQEGSRDITVDASGNVYTIGGFGGISDGNPGGGTIDLDPGVGTANFTSAGITDIFVSKLDSAGNFVWGTAMGGAGDDGGYGIALDTSGSVYTTGSFNGTVDFDPGAGTVTLTSVGEQDIFVSKFIQVPSSEGEGEGEEELQPILTVDPSSLSFSPEAGIFEVSVTNSGGGNFNWNAEVILGGSWLALDAAAKVYGDGTLHGSYTVNDLLEDRIGTIRITAVDALESPTDIAVTQLATEMALLSVASDRIGFGAVGVGFSVGGSTTIMNVGNVALHGIASTSPPFTVVSGATYIILPGDSHQVLLQFTPIGIGTAVGALSLSGGGGAMVELVGEGQGEPSAAVISVAHDRIDFGEVGIGSVATGTLAITNEGEMNLEGIASTSPPYSIGSGQSYTLFPGESHPITVLYTPTESGLATGVLSLTGGGGATVELVGTGTAEDEAADLCDALGSVNSEFELFKTEFEIADSDFDFDGLPEAFVLALLDSICDRLEGDDLRSATRIAYDINLMALAAEDAFEILRDFRHALAALLIISTDMQIAVSDTLLDGGVELTGTYEVVTVVDGVFMPTGAKGLSLAEGYMRFDSSAKSQNEPYSASGDLDEDGASNVEEYQNILASGGTTHDFVASATDPMSDGSQLPGSEGEGEGEGEGPPPLCGALWIDGAPISGGVGDLALLALVVGAMHCHRRRRRIQG